jgi:hypothetical protein
VPPISARLLELVETDPCLRIGVKLGISAQCLGDTVVLVIEDRR